MNMNTTEWFPGKRKVEGASEDINLNPKTAGEAFNLLKLLDERLRRNHFATLQEEGREIPFLFSKEGKIYQATIQDIIRQYGNDAPIAEYVAKKEAEQNEEKERMKKREIEEIKAELSKLDKRTQALRERLASLSK